MKNLRSAGVLGVLAVLAAGQLCSSLASAAGFIIPESSVEGIALADAVVANPHVPGAFTYNYASMLLREEASATLDMLAVQLQSSVKPAAPNAALGEIDNQADTALLPALYMTAPLTQYSALGLHIGVPFGLESVWPANTFSQFQSADTVIGAGGAIAGLQPLESSLEVIAISPSIGTRVGRDLALAIGVDYYNIDSVELVTTANRISGDGAETGWNLSAHYRFETWLLGVSYHAAVAARIDGEIKVILSNEPFDEILLKESRRASLVMLGFTPPSEEMMLGFYSRLKNLMPELPTTMFICSTGAADLFA